MISIVVCSIHEDRFSAFSENVKETIGVEYEIIRIDNRIEKLSICAAYNKGKRNCSYEIICFIHEDVLFYTNHWGSHLTDLFRDQNIGLAGIYGACYLSLFPDFWVDPAECQGQVIEGFREEKSINSSFRFRNQSITEVVAIDGVFMAAPKKVMSKYSFSEDLLRGFHGYDFDISMQVRQRYKIVVTDFILLLHFSKGSYDATYSETYAHLCRKWNAFLPAYTSAYSASDVIRLKLKSVNKLMQEKTRHFMPLGKTLMAIRYAWRHDVLKSWIISRLRKPPAGISAESTPVYSQNDPDKGFAKMTGNMNAYFSDHPERILLYEKELAFINHHLNGIPLCEKLFYTIIPYSFTLDYDYHQSEVHFDEAACMHYVYLGKHRLYYHRGFTNKEEIQQSFTFLTIEQHPDSPHRYLDSVFSIDAGDVVADIGAAEGNFSLMVADIAKEIIIVESDPIWMEALYKTFEPWKEKVRIINKEIGERNDDRTITLDQLQNTNKITAIKMDIEGAEIKVLTQAQSFLRENPMKMAIAAYHRESDAKQIDNLLKMNRYETAFTKGFMLFVYDILKPPFFRKGLVKARKYSPRAPQNNV
jgi:hypothetical protein